MGGCEYSKLGLRDHLSNQTIQSDHTVMENLFVLWIQCIDWEGYERRMSEMELRRLYDTWSKWCDHWVPYDVSEQCLPS